MDWHLGRMIDHLNIDVADLEAAKRFYRASAAALGREEAFEEGEGWFSLDELYVTEKGPDARASDVHLAFQARSEDDVRRWHAAVLAAGGRDNGAPGPRDYRPGYFAAFACDPDANNVEAVFHGPARRAAEAVVVTPEGRP